MNEIERLKKALHHEKTDRPPCICPGGMMNMITTDLMDRSGITWPEAHLNAEMMADLAQANYENGCFENVGVPFCMTIDQGCTGCNSHFEIKKSGCSDHWKYYRTGQYGKFGNGAGDIL